MGEWHDRLGAGLDEFTQSFEDQFRRPLPWMSLLEDDVLEALMTRVRASLGLPSDRNAGTVLAALVDRFRLGKRTRGWPGPDAIGRLVRIESLDVGSEITLLSGWWLGKGHLGSISGVQMRLGDLVQFERAFYREDDLVVEAGARWVMWAPHDHDAHILYLTPPRRFQTRTALH